MALFLPVVLALGSVVVSIGNWYVLKRHLQTQVDSSALAGGPAFTGCAQNPILTNANIRAEALKFAGDTLRDPTSFNPQLEEPGDTRVVLNSSTYWASGDPTDGSTHDWTIASPGTPCDTKFLDVKATDDRVPLLFKWIPLFPSPKVKARVEVSKVENTNGLRPLGVPEVDMEQVAVLFVNENGAANDPGAIRGKSFLTEDLTPPSGLEGMSVWTMDGITPVALNGNENFGVIVVASRSPVSNPISLNGTLSQICNQNPTQTHCYGGGTLTSGISFIHAYATTGSGTANDPIVRDAPLGGGCPEDLSAPYFNLAGGCPIGIQATIDFGTGANDPRLPIAQGGVCAEVSASPGGTMTWGGGIWTAAFTPAAESGANQVNITTTTDTNGGCNGGNNPSDTFQKVAKPYVADEASGPVQYIRVENTSGGLANSRVKDSNASLDVTVGFVPPLRDAMPGDPPIPLRFWDTPSQSQALDCANGASGWNNAMVNGCPDPYQIYDEAKHVSKCGPPPTGIPAADPADCIASKNGNFQQKGVTDLLEPCAENPNRWDGVNMPPPDDKRWMPLFILDELAFTQSGKKTYPIRRFGMFYVTAVSGLNCLGDDPYPAPSGKRTMFGHFVSYVTPGFGETIPGNVLCSFQDGGLCVSSLVE
jgi:hypothetical protein